MKEILLESLNDIPEAAEAIIQAAAGRHIIAFYGDMGAGKTTLISEIVAQLGSDDVVTSPTFALVNDYLTRDGHRIHHFDFYRIERPEEAFDIGYEEYFFSGDLCLVEWPEKIAELIPDDALHIKIEVRPDESRSIQIL